MNTSFYKRFCQNFLAAPLELRGYAFFSVLVTILGVGLPIFGPKWLWETIVPFTGWSPALGYMFGLFFTFSLICTKTRPCRMLGGIIAPLLLQIVFGLFEIRYLSHLPNDFHNPMLTISLGRPIWTVVIPTLWIAILLSPRVRQFGKVG